MFALFLIEFFDCVAQHDARHRCAVFVEETEQARSILVAGEAHRVDRGRFTLTPLGSDAQQSLNEEEVPVT